MSKRFLITENERNSILSLYTKKGIILEQGNDDIKTINNGNVTNDWQAGENLEKDINKIIQSVQNEIFRQITLQFVSGPNNEKTDPFVFSVLKNRKDTGQKITLKYEYIEDKENFQAYSVYRSFYKSISFGKTSIVEYLRPIFKNKDYITLFEKYPSVEEYVKNLTVDFGIEPYKSGDIAIGGVIRKGDGDYKLRRPIPFGDKITSIGSGVTIFKLKLNRKSYFSLELANAEMKLAEIKIPNPNVDPTPIPPDKFVPRAIGGGTSDPFKFNSIDLTGDGLSLLDVFVNQFLTVKRTDPDLYQTYLNFLNTNAKTNGDTKIIEVLAYSSIDGDPEQTINYVEGVNAVLGCGGRKLRKLYNQCLSEKRAEKIAGILNEKLSDFPEFIGVGMGETKQFNNIGWTKESPTKDTETLPNRRFEVNLPQYEDSVKVGGN